VTLTKEAKAEAARIAALIDAGDAAGAAMTGDGRRDLHRVKKIIAPF